MGFIVSARSPKYNKLDMNNPIHNIIQEAVDTPLVVAGALTPRFTKQALASVENTSRRSELLKGLYRDRDMYENAASDIGVAEIHIESWISEEPNREDLRLVLELLEEREAELYERLKKANSERKKIETSGTEVVFCHNKEKHSEYLVATKGEDPRDSLWYFNERDCRWYCPECAAWDTCATCEGECVVPTDGSLFPEGCPAPAKWWPKEEISNGNDA